MSAPAQTVRLPEGDAAPEGRVGFGAFLVAEWIKIRTVRSTFWTLIALAVVSIGITVLICSLSADSLAKDVAEGRVGNDEHPDQFLTVGAAFGQVAALVLGVLVMSSEYATGMIRSTLTAMPRRTSVLVAKALILLLLVFVVGTIVAFVGYFAANPFFENKDIGVPLDSPGITRALFGVGLYLAVLALFGFALALLLRHTAGAITVGLAMIFVIGSVVGLLPGEWGEWVAKLMPGNAGAQITTARQFDSSALSPWVGFGVFCLEVAVLLFFGWWRFNRKDA
ncbi:ABC transporter permease subunit [Yinghuangia soli]|uniref:ABC transporter permease n=1 Tax=Yinghuangia soli TaxID=2908204 RepID=A0AA41TZD8_9ACTN|nr:ABC transporter permease subunit [Yinghuangia soli]MCF2527401.1 ABC transporter permease [Yinghuangia soli]